MLPSLPSHEPNTAASALYAAIGVHGIFLVVLFVSLQHGAGAIIIPRDLPDDIPVFYSPTLKSGIQFPPKVGIPGGKGTVGKGKGKKRVMRVQKHSAKPVVKPVATKHVPTKSVAQTVAKRSVRPEPSRRVPRTDNKIHKQVDHRSRLEKPFDTLRASGVEPDNESANLPEEASKEEPEMPQGSPIIVGRDSVAQFEREMAIQRAVSERWSVPKGLSPKLTCLVQVTLDVRGGVQKWEIIQKSGVLAFDLAARTAALGTAYPEHVWGTTITLQFGHAS